MNYVPSALFPFHAAMDAFLSVADTDVQDAVAAAKQVAIEEQDTDAKQVAVEEQDTDAALRSSYITPEPSGAAEEEPSGSPPGSLDCIEPCERKDIFL